MKRQFYLVLTTVQHLSFEYKPSEIIRTLFPESPVMEDLQRTFAEITKGNQYATPFHLLTLYSTLDHEHQAAFDIAFNELVAETERNTAPHPGTLSNQTPERSIPLELSTLISDITRKEELASNVMVTIDVDHNDVSEGLQTYLRNKELQTYTDAVDGCSEHLYSPDSILDNEDEEDPMPDAIREELTRLRDLATRISAGYIRITY